VGGEPFFATYCDGLWDGDPHELLRFHKSHGRLATLTAVRAPSAFGILTVGENDTVEEFREKPPMDQWINGGFLVFSAEALSQFAPGDELERDTLARLAGMDELRAYRHGGFWQCMDTYKEREILERMWRAREAPWARGGGRE
jgi:glucose-1-phosphate cytidylyltransferase